MSILEEAATSPSSYYLCSRRAVSAIVLEFVRNGNVRRLARTVRRRGSSSGGRSIRRAGPKTTDYMPPVPYDGKVQ